MATSNHTDFSLTKRNASFLVVRGLAFSMLEVLSVIFVIALLFSLLLPSIGRIKKTSLNILCQKNMKDLHALMMSYAVDHNNVLPGTSMADHPEYISSESNNWSLYANWNGHLVSYIDPGRKNLTRDGKLRVDGQWYRRTTTPILMTDNNVNSDVLRGAETGSGAFKMFYCPDVIQNAIDPGLYYKAGVKGFNVLFPKMLSATVAHDNPNSFEGTGYGPSGIPTTYMMNNFLAQENGGGEPLQLSRVNNFGKKGLLMEAGCSGNSWYGSLSDPNFRDDHLSYTIMGFAMTHNNQFNWTTQKMTFIHDDEKEFWYSVVGNYGHPFSFMRETLNTFNELFCEGRNGDEKAYATIGGSYNGIYGSFGSRDALSLTLVTHKNPSSDSTHSSTLAKMYRGKGTWDGGFTYVSNQKIYEAGTGKTNLLFGDGSVATKHASWMFVNKDEIFNKDY